MSNYCQSLVSVKFNSEEAAKQAYLLFHDFLTQAFNGTFPKNSSDNGDYHIYDEDVSYQLITFSVDSQKEWNLDWQCERLSEFFKKQPGVMEIHMPIMVLRNSSYTWSREDDDL